MSAVGFCTTWLCDSGGVSCCETVSSWIKSGKLYSLWCGPYSELVQPCDTDVLECRAVERALGATYIRSEKAPGQESG